MSEHRHVFAVVHGSIRILSAESIIPPKREPFRPVAATAFTLGGRI